MSYKALYRTYRPQTFKEVVGQDVVVKTLQNAIANGKISHAYLFAGPRGTGKTTIARLFAKALNCLTPEKSEPCNKCITCQEIGESLSPDVIEIDAASNNGVDEIREIRDKVKFLPVGAKHKIYIIDEVHMLSAGAFNALLKTLEEPPMHVVFILATTEVQKLPATIISRCQRFDFKALSVKEIATKIKEVVGEEKVSISDEAINVISEAAEGGMRDALSILDQAISYADNEVTIEEVNLVTGNLSYDKLIELGTSFNEQNLNRSLEIIEDLIIMGKEVGKLVNNLIQFYRDMLLFQNVDSPMYVKYIFEKEAFKKLAKTTTQKQIFYYLDILSDVQVKIKYSSTPRIYLETAIIKMINMSNDDLNLASRLTELENRMVNMNFVPEIDNEKINLIDVKLNRVVSELSKLELHKLSERVSNLEAIKPTVVNSDNSEVTNKLHQLEESLLILNTSFSNLKNQIDNGTTSHVDNSVIKRLENLENGDFSHLNNFQMDIDSLKLQLVKVENSKFEINEKVINEFKERISTLEKRVYSLLSNDLASKNISKKSKGVSKQMGLFDEETTLEKEDFNVDFKGLSKVEEKTEQTEPIVTPIMESKEPIPSPIAVIISSKGVDPSSKEVDLSSKEVNPFPKEPISAPTEIENKTEEKPSQSLFENERKLVEEMRPNITFSSKVSTNPDVVEVKVNNTVPVNEADRYSSYDVKIIEGILHESRTEAARNDAKRINQLWNNLSRGATPESLGVIDTLREGKITAVGNKEFLLVYANATLCNQVMRTKFKNDALKIIYDQLGDSYNYIALPEHVWLAKRTEYVNQYNIGIKYPKLTPILDESLVIITDENEYIDPKEKVINHVKEIFGDDIVKVE